MRWAEFAHKHKLVDVQDYLAPVHTHVLADITDLGDLVSVKPATSIVNAFSGGGYSVAQYPAGFGKLITCGALEAAVYGEVLSVVGAGFINLLSVVAGDASARTIGVKVEIDGVSVFDAVSNSIAAINKGMVVIGWNTAAGISGLGHSSFDVPFTTGFKVYVKSSLTETDLVNTYVSYILT